MPREVRVSMSALRKAYADRSRSTSQIAADFGMSTRTLHKIVKQEGWGHRTSRKVGCTLTPESIRPLWDAGLSVKNIAAILGASTHAVQAYANRYGMRRSRGWRPTVTLAQWREDQMARAWAAERRAA